MNPSTTDGEERANSLDEKIVEAVLGKSPGTGMPIPNFVEKIKQAFADDVKQKLMDGRIHGVSIHEYAAKGLKDTMQKEQELMGKEHILMTGEEFYQRFEKELYKPKPQEYPINRNDDGESHDRFFRAGGANFMYNKALEAAKRAAGITNEA